MKGKSQSALEFLTTYGWAFLVILIMIGALAFFGVLNPQRFLPDRCISAPGFYCEEFQISQNTLQFAIRNQQGSAINLNNITATAEGLSGVAFTDCNFVETQLSQNELTFVNCAVDGIITDGSKIKVSYVLDYSFLGRTLSRRAAGEIFGTVARATGSGINGGGNGGTNPNIS